MWFLMRIVPVHEIPANIRMNYFDSEKDDVGIAVQARIFDGLAGKFNSELFLKIRYGLPHVLPDSMSRVWRFKINNSFYAAIEAFTDILTKEKTFRIWLDYTNSALEERYYVYTHFINIFTEEIKKIKTPRVVRNRRKDRIRFLASVK